MFFLPRYTWESWCCSDMSPGTAGASCWEFTFSVTKLAGGAGITVSGVGAGTVGKGVVGGSTSRGCDGGISGCGTTGDAHADGSGWPQPSSTDDGTVSTVSSTGGLLLRTGSGTGSTTASSTRSSSSPPSWTSSSASLGYMYKRNYTYINILYIIATPSIYIVTPWQNKNLLIPHLKNLVMAAAGRFKAGTRLVFDPALFGFGFATAFDLALALAFALVAALITGFFGCVFAFGVLFVFAFALATCLGFGSTSKASIAFFCSA